MKTPLSTNYKVRDKMGIYDNSVSWNANRTVHTPAKIGSFCSWLASWLRIWTVAAILEADGLSASATAAAQHSEQHYTNTTWAHPYTFSTSDTANM